MRATSAGELADAFDGRLAPLADDVSGAKGARQRDAIGVTTCWTTAS